VWQIKQVSFGCFREDRCRESLDTVDLDIVECSDCGRIENVIWLNFSVHAVPLGINEPVGRAFNLRAPSTFAVSRSSDSGNPRLPNGDRRFHWHEEP
jgi:hypothetical protein